MVPGAKMVVKFITAFNTKVKQVAPGKGQQKSIPCS